ncbi:HNH endonuclease [Streptomyces phage TunaTartare]|uniref:HNH endonuclease n=1 Tax=Streptomyces phage TunaTartare TaxID=2848887 RepID=A0A8F2IWJ0_9CAUD|nr:HNH endonuclease [Streptomyces phage TunaTartare]QWT29991.1 HNH endonuclease [Streptomyces phage TunaTartare]
MKTCTGCGNEFPLEEMATRSSKCKPCHREYTRNHYANNKQYYVDKAVRSKATVLQKIRAEKEKPCADCGVSYPYYVMDFDHLENKEFNISEFKSRYGWTRLKKEIDKCDVVCANCHRIRTFERSQ